MTTSTKIWAAVVGLALVSAAMWFAWLGWDTEYYEVDGVAQGPYRAWQVIGCGLSIAVATVVASLWVWPAKPVLRLSAAAIIGFAVPWTIDAAASDESGLFVVGLLMLLIGGGFGLLVLLLIVGSVRDAIGPKR